MSINPTINRNINSVNVHFDPNLEILTSICSDLEDNFITEQQLPVYFVSLFPVFSSFICVYSQFWSGSYSNV